MRTAQKEIKKMIASYRNRMSRLPNTADRAACRRGYLALIKIARFERHAVNTRK